MRGPRGCSSLYADPFFCRFWCLGPHLQHEIQSLSANAGASFITCGKISWSGVCLDIGGHILEVFCDWGKKGVYSESGEIVKDSQENLLFTFYLLAEGLANCDFSASLTWESNT